MNRPTRQGWRVGLALLAAAAAAAYGRTFSAPFVFDDTRAILRNRSILHLWPLGPVLAPPERMTTSGRPLANLSFALNYAAGGFNVWGYHAVNLLIHLACGLVLAAVVRRAALAHAARVPAARRRLSPEALGLATALLWLVHPLLTEAVTYVVQRAEALSALCCLVMLYALARGAERPLRGWGSLAVLACFCGMATKETMAAAPLVALLFDRTFFSGTFGSALRRRGWLYLGLASSWLLLGGLIASGHGRGGSVGAVTAGQAGGYLLTQGWAILHYLRLALWPSPLVFDYGTGLLPPATAAPFALATLALLVLSLVALRKWPVAGFLGVSFFALLAPSSSVVPVITETIAEHRMYLPLALALVGLILAVDRVAAVLRLVSARTLLALWAGAAVGLAWATAGRNEDYRDPVRLWTSAVHAWPQNARAHANLAEAQISAGDWTAAAASCQAALRLDPGDARIWFNLGEAELGVGDGAAAIAAFAAAVRLDASSADAHLNLAVALEQAGRPTEADAHFATAAALAPDDNRILVARGEALLRAGDSAVAASWFERALRLRPEDGLAHLWLGNTWAQSGRVADAAAEYALAARFNPDDAMTRNNWGSALFQLGRLSEAASQFRAALALRPDYPSARAALARVEARLAERSGAPGS